MLRYSSITDTTEFGFVPTGAGKRLKRPFFTKYLTIFELKIKDTTKLIPARGKK